MMKILFLFSTIALSIVNHSGRINNCSNIEFKTNLTEANGNYYMPEKYKSFEDGFEISFTSKPEIIKETIINEIFGNYDLVRYISNSAEGAELISVSRYPDSYVKICDEDEAIKGCIKGYESGLHVSATTTDFKIDGNAGKLTRFYSNNIFWVAGIIYKNGKLFQIIILRQKAYPTDSYISQYISSFSTFK